MSAARPARGGAEILVLRFGSLGDVVLTFPALSLLAARAPAARIVYLTKQAYAPLVATHAAVDEVIALTAADRGPRGALRLARRLRARRFAEVLDLHATPRSRFLSAWSGAPVRRRVANRALARRGLVAGATLRRLLRRAPPSMLPAALCAPAAAIAAARVIDPRIRARHDLPAPDLRLPAPALKAAAALWGPPTAGGRAIALCPGARHATKSWPGFPELARALRGRGDRVLVALGPADVWNGPAGQGVTIARGSLVELAAALAQADAAAGNDSGLTHVAAAAGAPVVVLFGPTVPALGFLPVGPHRAEERLDLNCRPCSVHGGSRCPRGDHACLAGITPARVLARLDEMAPARRQEATHAR